MAATNAIHMDLLTDLRYLDLVDQVSHSVTKVMGFDEDRIYWIGMSVREGVINAMLHGNQMDIGKRVVVRFEMAPSSLAVSIHDQGRGFDPACVPNPVAPENLLKPCGRGLFCIKSFMDDVSFNRQPDGMEIRLLKRLASE
ncbi:MAG: ATP-binding protein [Acidobacteria bacterium]|nr:ATP-binding protein [Acidobacteriota bacterium]